MRIEQVTNKFVNMRNVRGCEMKAVWSDQVMTLAYKYDNRLIAEIFDYKDSKNFRLRLHPTQNRYGRTSHNNRIFEVLRSVQVTNTGGDYHALRYGSFIRYAVKLNDRKLQIEYNLTDHPLEFDFIDGKLTLDYKVLERNAFPNETPVVAELEQNSSLQTLDNKLNAILAGV